MKIVILGAGQVGSTVANSLSSEENDITVVDTNARHLKELGKNKLATQKQRQCRSEKR